MARARTLDYYSPYFQRGKYDNNRLTF